MSSTVLPIINTRESPDNKLVAAHAKRVVVSIQQEITPFVIQELHENPKIVPREALHACLIVQLESYLRWQQEPAFHNASQHLVLVPFNVHLQEYRRRSPRPQACSSPLSMTSSCCCWPRSATPYPKHRPRHLLHRQYYK